MNQQQNQQQIKSIYRMLLEIANGNLNYRMVVEGNDAQFDELVTLLNKIADKLQEIGYSNPYHNSTNSSKGSHKIAELMVQKVQEYILENLEEPIPSTKELSIMFATNEFTLKDSFRKVVKTSIYQFYNQERLKKAHFFIEQTQIPLKQIALICGFNSYTNFLKAFKKKYNFTPSELNRHL